MTILLVLIVLAAIAVYVFFIRPVLKKRPTLQDYYAREESWIEAVRLKFSGMKQWFTTVLSVAAGVVVTVYDTIVQFAPQVGFAWSNTKTITSMVPEWAWPLIGIALLSMVQWFREINNRRVAQVMKENGVDPKLALIEPAAK